MLNPTNPIGRRTKPASIMTALGLPDFETPSDCDKRQRALPASVGSSSDGRIVTHDLAECDRDGCGQAPCLDACHFAAGRRRRRLIPQLRDAFAIATCCRRALWLARRYRLAPNMPAGVASSAFSGRGRA